MPDLPARITYHGGKSLFTARAWLSTVGFRAVKFAALMQFTTHGTYKRSKSCTPGLR